MTKVSYCTVKFVTGSIPTSVPITDAAKDVLVKERGVDKRKIRGSYSILTPSRHKLLSEGSALKRILVEIRRAYTIPKYIVSTAAGSRSLTEKLDGEYLIEATRVDEFLTQFNTARQNYLNWGDRVCEEENYKELLEIDKTALADEWPIIEGKYPSRDKLKSTIRCSVPEIIPFDVNFELSDVAPETAEKLKSQIAAQLEASANGAIAELQLELQNMVASVIKSCGKRIRLLPAIGSPNEALRNSEVQEILTSADSEDIPVGHLLVKIQNVKAKGDGFVNEGDAVNMLLTEAEYKALHPYETNEYRSLAKSSFENVMALTDRINKVKAMLGDSDETKGLNDLAVKISTMLASAGGSAADITKQIKNSSIAREEIRKSFGEFEKTIKSQIELSKTSKNKVKRKVNFKENGD